MPVVTDLDRQTAEHCPVVPGADRLLSLHYPEREKRLFFLIVSHISNGLESANDPVVFPQVRWLHH
jgi:hypothetical protein